MTTTSAAQAAVAQPTGTRPAGRRRTITLWTTQVVLALFFLVAAAGPKLAGEQTAVKTFEDMGAPWLRYVVGVLELAGAIGLLVPRLAGLAALCLSALMVGATVTQLFILGSPVLALTPLVLAVVFALIARARRHEIADLTRRTTR